MRDVELSCRNTVNKSLLLLFFIIILQAVLPKKKKKEKTYSCFYNALMGSHSLLTDPLFSLKVRLGREPP